MILYPKTATFSFRSCFVLLTFLLLSHSVFGQCPVPNNCTPGNAPASSFPFGMGIYNVNVGSGATGFTNATSGGASAGYQDYSCTIQATIPEGVAIPIAIATNPNANENVRVWLDLNNDGIFDNTSELIFASQNAKNHTGSFTVPVSASVVKNVVLRMRVAADNFASPLPTPCFTPQYSQVEDYGITVVPNTNKPAVDFSANNPITCSPMVQFQNLTQNGATSYLWDFGDGNMATSANPNHTYAATGTYSVKLTACNANGCDSLTKTNFITYQANTVMAASCAPATLNYCCGYGITSVNFGNGLMTNTSADGSVGYEDFTCTKILTVEAGETYPFEITTGNNPHDTRIYIDLNNDGSFNAGNELVLELLNQANPSGILNIPGPTSLNTPLRMRIISDEIGSSFTSCSNIQSGQAEDYTIVIEPNSNPIPLHAQFASNYSTSCDTIVQFTDQSTNSPIAWLWNFGDPASGSANTSTHRNPVHIYHNPGSYTVTLTVMSSTDTSTISKTNYIKVVKPCITYCPLQGYMNRMIYFNKVKLGDLNNTSGTAASNYADLTHLTANLVQGNTDTLTAAFISGGLSVSVSGWIDFNQNGIFEVPERVMFAHANEIINRIASATFTVPANALLGPTRMRLIAIYSPGAQVDPCQNLQISSSVEDYTVFIHSPSAPPIANFVSPNQVSCNGKVIFKDQSIVNPISWNWNFYDPASGKSNTSTFQNPIHQFSNPGTYTVSLTVCNTNGCNTIIKPNFVVYQPDTTILPASCYPQTANPCCNKGIKKVYLTKGAISNTSGNSSEGYQDYTCLGGGVVKYYERQRLEVETYDANDQVMAWIDYNNDGIFGSGEVVINASANIKNVSFIFPANVVTGVPLRMRIMSEDPVFPISGPCHNVQKGQVEDYAITVLHPPVPNFSNNSNISCSGTISFSGSVSNTTTSWQWNFGDPSSGQGNISNLQNPTHTYSASGHYTVTLETCNDQGCNTTSRIIYVSLNQNISLPQGCFPYSDSIPTALIQSIDFAGLNHTTGSRPTTYSNYSCDYFTSVIYGNTYPLNIRTVGYDFYKVKVWIDFDNDGYFNNWEKVYDANNSIFHTGNIRIAPGGPVVRNTYLRMRVMSVLDYGLPYLPCDDLKNGETEDYAIMILDPTGISESNFTNQISLFPNPSNGTFSLQIPSILKGGFQVEAHNLIGQKVAVKNIKPTGEIHPIDLRHLPKGVYLVRIFNAEFSTVKKLIIE